MNERWCRVAARVHRSENGMCGGGFVFFEK